MRRKEKNIHLQNNTDIPGSILDVLCASPQEETVEEVLVEEDVQKQNEIILYNDDVNTFDHVIETLIQVCDHTPEQAEQCSIIVHYKGKCTVRTGPYEDLEPRCSMLLDAGLSAEIL